MSALQDLKDMVRSLWDVSFAIADDARKRRQEDDGKIENEAAAETNESAGAQNL